MASTIKLKNGSGAPTTGDLVQGEPALDLTNKRLYTENASGVVIEVGTNPSTIDINAGTIDGTVIGGSTAAAITGTTITGTSFVSSGDMTFGDSDKAIFGAGSDLQIYHDGSESYIDDAGTGSLLLRGSNSVQMRKQGTTELMLRAVVDADVELYYDGSEKLATTATGIDVTGTVTADKVTIGTSSASNGKLTLEGVDGSDSAGIYFNNTTATNGKSYSLSSGNSGEFMLYDRTSSAYRLFVSSAGSVGIGTSSPSDALVVEGDVASPHRIVVSNANASGSETLSFKQGATVKSWVEFNNSTSNFDVWQYTNNPLRFGTNNTERARIDSSGRVGIGTTSPISPLQVLGTGTLGYATSNAISSGMSAISNASAFNNIGSAKLTANFGGAVDFTGRASELVFAADNGNFGGGGGFAQGLLGAITASSVNGNASTLASNLIFYNTAGNSLTERMRIDSSGNLLVGRTTTIDFPTNTTSGIRLGADRFDMAADSLCRLTQLNNASGTFDRFYIGSSIIGTITGSGSTTSYNTSSDERLKENITDAPVGNIDDIKVRSFDWKADGSHQDYGMVAQELEAVAPYAVTKGQTEDDMWSVDYSKLVPMLIKEIQDLKAEVAALKGAN
jgi:hypothetical protein